MIYIWNHVFETYSEGMLRVCLGIVFVTQMPYEAGCFQIYIIGK